MILPCPVDPKGPSSYPMTWALLALNLIVMLVFFSGPEDRSEVALFKSENLQLAGRIYFELLDQAEPAALSREPDWVRGMVKGQPDHMEFLGAHALKNADFLARVEGLPPVGDEIAFAKFQKEIKKFKDSLAGMAMTRFGLSSQNQSSLSWVTYQFAHAGWIHLLSNLVFLFFLGFVIESLWGGFALLLIYLAGGIAGGMFFLNLNPHGLIPMVGASGSVSALLAFYAAAEVRWRIRYYYMILPIPGQHGFIHLPTMLIWPLFLVSDLAGILSVPEGLLSGIAYSAHLGGAALGLGMGLVLRLFEKIDGRPNSRRELS